MISYKSCLLQVHVVYSCLYAVLQMSSTAGTLFQNNLAGHLLQDLLSQHPLSLVLPAVVVDSQLLQIELSVILSGYFFVLKQGCHQTLVKKNVFIRWLLTLFKKYKEK